MFLHFQGEGPSHQDYQARDEEETVSVEDTVLQDVSLSLKYYSCMHCQN